MKNISWLAGIIFLMAPLAMAAPSKDEEIAFAAGTCRVYVELGDIADASENDKVIIIFNKYLQIKADKFGVTRPELYESCKRLIEFYKKKENV